MASSSNYSWVASAPPDQPDLPGPLAPSGRKGAPVHKVLLTTLAIEDCFMIFQL